MYQPFHGECPVKPKRHPSAAAEWDPMKVVMGVDPGAANLGFGVVRIEGSHMVALDGGVIETSPEQPLERRLERIHKALSDLLDWHEPKALAIEDLYFGRNVRSAMAVGQACGVTMLAAAQRGVGCFAYTPQAIKMAVCGSGAAGKKQVQRMVGTLLGLPEPPSPDHAADALAVAICHAGNAPQLDAIAAYRTSPETDSSRAPEKLAG
jgi:crossover junction endodeoxyribonuclease RuvC